MSQRLPIPILNLLPVKETNGDGLFRLKKGRSARSADVDVYCNGTSKLASYKGDFFKCGMFCSTSMALM